MRLPFAWEHAIGLIGAVGLVGGCLAGLFWAPREMMMGDVSRILYVHVPAAWACMLAFTAAFVGAVGYLSTGRASFDYLVEACAEVGVVLGIVACVCGSLFAGPTWNTYWTWEPRLTSTAVMILSFVGVSLLRGAVLDFERRALWSAVASIMASVNVPITYFSVQWWQSMHQQQSTPATVSSDMKLIWRLNALFLILVTVWMVARRWRIAKARMAADLPVPLEQVPA